jgi:hypothetical protein
MSGVEVAFVIGAIVAIVGALIVIGRLPSVADETLTTKSTELKRKRGTSTEVASRIRRSHDA